MEHALVLSRFVVRLQWILAAVGTCLGLAATVSAAVQGSIYPHIGFHLWIFSPFYLALVAGWLGRNRSASGLHSARAVSVGLIAYVAVAGLAFVAQAFSPDPTFAVGLLLAPAAAYLMALVAIVVL